jgi:pyruvate carboxylase
MKGDLGFPHRGFPIEVENAILKGAKKREIRAGLVLPPADFNANIAALNAKWCGGEGFPGESISPEQAMSSLMYPAVFADYMKRRRAKGRVLQYLPTPVYLYAMAPGDAFTMTMPSSVVADVAKASPAGSGDLCEVAVELRRVCPLKDGKRKVIFAINGVEQHFDIKDTSGAFVFEGDMADPKNTNEV